MSFFKDKDFVKETGEKLTQALNAGDTEVLQILLNETIGEMATGVDKSALFPYIVKMCSTTDLICKKLVYLYINQYAKCTPDLALLAINSLQKDTLNPNAMVRGLALKTLCDIRGLSPNVSLHCEKLIQVPAKLSAHQCSMLEIVQSIFINIGKELLNRLTSSLKEFTGSHQRLPEFLEYLKAPLLAGLEDRSPYVRQIAVVGCLKVHKMQSNFARDYNIPNFDELLFDTDPGVVVTAIKVFFEMRKDNGKDFTLTQNIAINLLNRLPQFNDWGKASILQLLLVYQPQCEQEIFDILNLLDPLLQSSNSSVSIATVTLMLHYTFGMLEVHKDVFTKLRKILVHLLSHEQEEMVYISLCHLQQLQRNSDINLVKHYKKLFCRYNEPSHIKCLKIDILEMICHDKNWKEILEEFNSHCLDLSPQVSDRAISGIANIARKKDTYSEPAFKILLYLLEVDRVAGSAISAIKDLLDFESFHEYKPLVFEAIPSLWSRVEDQRGKIALLWIIGEHGKDLHDAPYLLESMIDSLEENQRPLILSNLLTATSKLFFSRPAECQDMLGKLLEYCVENQGDIHLREKGQFYYQLLNEDVNIAREVIFSAKVQERELVDKKETSPPIINSLDLLFKPRMGKNKEQQNGMKETPSPQTPVSAAEGQLIDITATLQEQEVNGEDPVGGNLLRDLDKTSLSLDPPIPMLISDTRPLEVETTDQSAEETSNRGASCNINLEKLFSLSPEDFESKWISLESMEMELWAINLNVADIMDKMETAGISTMASTPEGAFPWSTFLYAKDDASNAVFLVKIVVNSEDATEAEVTVKCTTDSTSTRQDFQSLLQEILSQKEQ